ncbi:unnamed protein product, partial [Ectocarpus sp. 13 AM-2016]
AHHQQSRDQSVKTEALLRETAAISTVRCCSYFCGESEEAPPRPIWLLRFPCLFGDVKCDDFDDVGTRGEKFLLDVESRTRTEQGMQTLGVSSGQRATQPGTWF